MIVMKFGGSSVANREQIEKVLDIVRKRLEQAPVVVCSAHKGMTDALIGAARAAAAGQLDPEPVIARQQAVADSLGCEPDLLTPFYGEIRDLLRGISLVRELSPRSLDFISSFGERMSVRCIASFLAQHGLKARAYDAWKLGFITDRNFGRARPLPGYEERMRAHFAVLPEGQIPVITGFAGRTTDGEITTVGRNGSDLTATLIASALGASEVQIWSDTDGVLSADPSFVDGARNIPLMHFEEAAELAYFGSRVLHPSSLLPAMRNRVPVRVLNTNRPEHPGTVIDDHAVGTSRAVTSIAYKEKQIVVNLRSTRMFGQAGFLARVFEVAGRHGLVVDQLATSEISISMTAADEEALERALPEFEQLGICSVSRNKTLLVVVGQNLANQAGIGAEILAAVAKAGVNVEMISYGLHSINFAMMIDDADIHRAVPVLHRMLLETSA